MRHTIKTTLADVDVTVIAHISPSVSPTFHDPGDPGERSVEAVLIKNLRTGQEIDIADCFDPQALEALADEAYEDAMDRLDDTP